MQWVPDDSVGTRAAKEATVQTTSTTDPRSAACADRAATTAAVRNVQPLFPPKDADAEARRRWLASSPWPEVVFASAAR